MARKAFMLHAALDGAVGGRRRAAAKQMNGCWDCNGTCKRRQRDEIRRGHLLGGRSCWARRGMYDKARSNPLRVIRWMIWGFWAKPGIWGARAITQSVASTAAYRQGEIWDALRGRYRHFAGSCSSVASDSGTYIKSSARDGPQRGPAREKREKKKVDGISAMLLSPLSTSNFVHFWSV